MSFRTDAVAGDEAPKRDGGAGALGSPQATMTGQPPSWQRGEDPMTLPWPEGKKAAASFTFDFDAESAWIGMDSANAKRPGVLSQGTYGAKVAVPLILDVLARHDLKASFFIPGVNAELHREAVDMIVQAGHELGLHGYTHTAPSLLGAEEEQQELDRAYDLLTEAGGIITGYRSPSWDVSAVTLDLLERKKLRYASQFMDDIRPYRHVGRRLVELPVQWILDDWPHFAWHAADSARTIRGTSEVEAIWLEEFESIRHFGGSFILTMHPQIIGRPSRVDLLDRLISHVLACEDVWTTTCAEMAAHADAVLPATVESRP
jgi:peptidoglycan/xylan/chitin deacetylase (PgdA/CDA1 family)